jgi:hypothetical protein
MEDSEKRPNANYKLSKSDDAGIPQEGLTFHYNRERRLAKAPKEVQDLYKEKKTGRFNPLHLLLADRPRKVLFFSIVLLCIIITILSILGLLETAHILDGNKITVSATNFEGTTIIVVRKTVEKTNVYTGPIEIAVSVPTEEEEYPVFYHKIFFTVENEEIYRFAVPFEDPELLMILQNEKNSLKLIIKPQ